MEGPAEGKKELTSHETEVVHDILSIIGMEEVHRRALDFAPTWVTNIAISAELNDNWNNTYQSRGPNDVQKDGNVIDSHFVFKVKIAEDGSKSLKQDLVHMIIETSWRRHT